MSYDEDGVKGKQLRLPIAKTDHDAEILLAVTKEQIANGTFVFPDDGLVTFDEVAQRWLAVRAKAKLEGGTVDNKLSRLRVHLYPRFQGRPIRDIDLEDVERMMAELVGKARESKTKSMDVPRKVFFDLRGILDYALKHKLRPDNPCDDAEDLVPPDKKAEARTPATLEQLRDVLEAIGPRYRTPVIFACLTGLRAGEVWALKREDLDLGELPRVRVADALRVVSSEALGMMPAQEREGFLVTKGVKNGRTHFISIGRDLADMVEAHMARYPGRVGSEHLVFTSPRGAAVRHNNWYKRVYQPAIAKVQEASRAKGKYDRLPDGFNFHDLRHTWATVMADAGFDLSVIGKSLNHDEIRVTKDYTMAGKKLRRQVGEAGDEAMRVLTGAPTVARRVPRPARRRRRAGDRRIH